MMKQFKYFITILLLGSFLFSCSEDEKKAEQPGFIQLSVKGNMVFTRDIFEISVPSDPDIVRYEWILPEQLTIIEGEGQSKITVQAGGKKATLPDKSIGVIAYNDNGASVPRYFYQTLSIGLIQPPLENYKTKRYGNKIWMIENLNEKGENGDLGKYYNNDPAKGEIYGRLYTWHEAMTGIPNCTAEQNPYKWGSEGTDDVEEPYKMDGTKNAFNIQIQGVCPDGWHIPNQYDMYDLLVAIKDDYRIPASSFADIASLWEGYIVGAERDAAPAAITLTNWGYVGAYLKGSSPKSEGGLWQGGTTFSYGGNATFPNSTQYPLYMDKNIREEIGFLILPGGKFNSGTGKFDSEGSYSFHWTSLLRAEGKAFRRTIGSANVNFSNGDENLTNAFSVRCVGNY